MSLLLDDLRKEIKKGNVLIIVGAGVSIAATKNHPAASWTGLLKSGIKRCLDLKRDPFTNWKENVRQQIESGNDNDLLLAAEDLSRRLGSPNDPEYGRWLSEMFSSLKATDRRLITALKDLDLPIMTTNYDTLIEQETGFLSVSWKNEAQAQRVLRGDVKGVFHLHGVWTEPDSVILDIRSYERVLNNEFIQTMLRSCLSLRTLLFVGFGAGLRDPNFGRLRDWLSKVLSNSHYRHYRLVRNNEEQTITQEYGTKERIVPISFGKDFSDLTPFLENLRPSSLASRNLLPVFDERTASLDQRLVALESQHSSLLPQEYLVELSKISFDFAAIGAKRSAWYMLRSPFSQYGSDLESDERVQIGLKLVEIMLDDDVADVAMFVIQELTPDIDKLSPDDPARFAFWDLQSRCFTNLAQYSDAVSSLEQALLLVKDSDIRSRLIAELAEIQFLHGEFEKVIKDFS